MFKIRNAFLLFVEYHKFVLFVTAKGSGAKFGEIGTNIRL